MLYYNKLTILNLVALYPQTHSPLDFKDILLIIIDLCNICNC